MRESVILEHADRRVPRYTSYPTAAQFSADVDEDAYARWLADLPPSEPISLYLHVPFCREICWYCGCHTRATRREAPIGMYADALIAEIDTLATLLPARMAVRHIHWGGGSPTSLGADRLLRLMSRIRQRFDVLPSAEVAIEIDPRHFSPALDTAIREAGFNRASLGVQTFDPRVQAAVNRVQSADVVAHCIDRLRRSGIGGINVDLLYGLPLQSVRSCRQTVHRLVEYVPDRLSVFGYAHVPHMKANQKMIRAADLPDAATRLRQADAISGELAAAGYVPIGLDHFARHDDPLARAQETGKLRRNFQGYTTDDATTLIGLGASSIGWLPQGYAQNTPLIRDWQRRVSNGGLPIARGRVLTADDRLRRDIIERLMCDLSADVGAIAARHHLPVPVADLSVFTANSVASLRDGVVTVDPSFRPLVRSVAAAFDIYLSGSGARHSLAI